MPNVARPIDNYGDILITLVHHRKSLMICDI